MLGRAESMRTTSPDWRSSGRTGTACVIRTSIRAVAGIEIREVKGWFRRRAFVDVPFRVHANDPSWIPPLRLSVYDRLSPQHPESDISRAALPADRPPCVRLKPLGL